MELITDHMRRCGEDDDVIGLKAHLIAEECAFIDQLSQIDWKLQTDGYYQSQLSNFVFGEDMFTQLMDVHEMENDAINSKTLKRCKGLVQIGYRIATLETIAMLLHTDREDESVCELLQAYSAREHLYVYLLSQVDWQERKLGYYRRMLSKFLLGEDIFEDEKMTENKM